jgi:uncharacterized membrane protein
MKKSMIDSISDKLTYWNGGFYSNDKDSRILVPKSRPGMGWTLNFGNPKAVRLFMTILILIVVMIIAFSLIFGVQSHW